MVQLSVSCLYVGSRSVRSCVTALDESIWASSHTEPGSISLFCVSCLTICFAQFSAGSDAVSHEPCPAVSAIQIACHAHVLHINLMHCLQPGLQSSPKLAPFPCFKSLGWIQVRPSFPTLAEATNVLLASTARCISGHLHCTLTA